MLPRRRSDSYDDQGTSFQVTSVSLFDEEHEPRASVAVKSRTAGALVEELNHRASSVIGPNQLLPVDLLRGALDQKLSERLGPEIFNFIQDTEKKQLSVVWELVQTERDYVRDMYLLVEVLVCLHVEFHEANGCITFVQFKTHLFHFRQHRADTCC